MPQSRTPESTHETPSQQQKASSNIADITRDSERGQPNEESLRDSQARLSGIVDSAMDAIITVDEKQLVLVFNRAAERMFHCPAKEAIGQSLDRFIPKRFRPSHSSHIHSFGKTSVTTRAMAVTRSVYGLRADGEEFPVEASISQVEAGGQKLFTVIMRDITERKRADDRFRQLIEGAPNGMVMVDHEGKIVLVNAEIEKSFGYSRDELLGQPIEMLVPVRFRRQHPGYRDGFIAAPTARTMGSGRDLFGLRKDGSEFPVEIGLNPLPTDQGTMVLGTIVDITERKRAEEELRRGQEQLAGVIGSAMDAIITVDADQRIVLFNGAAERMFLYPAEDAIGQPLDRFIPQRFRPSHQGHIEKFGRTNVTRRTMGSLGAIFGLRADGEEFPMEASISQLESKGHKFFTVILRDITERKHAEEVLREQARVLDLAPVFIRDLSGRIIFWNSGSAQMLGWTQDEALEKFSHSLLQTEFPRPLEEIKARLFAHGQWRGELIHTRRDGERIVVASHWVLQKDADDKPRAILEVNNDITERKRAEELRLNSELRYRRLFESSKEGILILDADSGQIVDVNPHLIEMLGFSKGDLVGKELWEIGVFRDIVASKLAFTELQQQEYIRYEHLPLEGRDGLVRQVEFVSNSYLAGESHVIQCSIRDITDRKQAEDEIRRLNEELEQRVADRTIQLLAANKELEAFSYSVSHDLRAPLRHINGFSQALLEDYADKLDATGKGYLQEVRGASQEMAQLIDDVLQLARVTRSEMRREKVDLTELARSIASEMQKRDAARTVAVDIEEELSTRGDKRLLGIMLGNLLGNAWKFTSKSEGAKITFGHTRRGAEFVYFVRDNGAGFDMAYVGKLFGAFQRLHTAGEFEGTGIGLATVQRIVHRHGGRVWAEGALNQGATFYFTFADFEESGNGKPSDLTG